MTMELMVDPTNFLQKLKDIVKLSEKYEKDAIPLLNNPINNVSKVIHSLEYFLKEDKGRKIICFDKDNRDQLDFHLHILDLVINLIHLTNQFYVFFEANPLMNEIDKMMDDLYYVLFFLKMDCSLDNPELKQLLEIYRSNHALHECLVRNYYGFNEFGQFIKDDFAWKFKKEMRDLDDNTKRSIKMADDVYKRMEKLISEKYSSK